MTTTSDLAHQILSLIDLTSLNESDNEDTIKILCEDAHTKDGSVAAVCVYPQFIKLAKYLLLNTPIKIATVANFPTGEDNLVNIVAAMQQAIVDGVNEIDMVMPYKKYLAGGVDETKNFVTACKNTCGPDICLKVILETGALQDPVLIANASRDVLLAGADFIKTSTGKISTGATLDDARIMLNVIRELHLDRIVGFKAAGGIRTFDQATQYLQLANEIMGSAWVSPQTFRLGASVLIKDIFKYL